MPWSLNGMVAEALAYHSDFAMNDNEGTIPQQIAHLEGIAATMRDDLKEARAGLQAKPGDERLAKQVNALERLLNGLLVHASALPGPAGAAETVRIVGNGGGGRDSNTWYGTTHIHVLLAVSRGAPWPALAAIPVRELESGRFGQSVG